MSSKTATKSLSHKNVPLKKKQKTTKAPSMPSNQDFVPPAKPYYDEKEHEIETIWVITIIFHLFPPLIIMLGTFKRRLFYKKSYDKEIGKTAPNGPALYQVLVRRVEQNFIIRVWSSKRSFFKNTVMKGCYLTGQHKQT